MPFRPIAPSKDVDTSSLAGLGKSVLDGLQWAYVQFNSVASAMQATEPIKIWNSPPPKPREGTITYADGTNWNPGYGEGPYGFNSLGQWFPMSANAAYGAYAPWTTYAVAIQAGSTGSYTGPAYGRYKLLGKICFITLRVGPISSFGAAGYPVLNLPVTAASGVGTQHLAGREVAVTGYMVSGEIGVSGTFTTIIKYDGAQAVTANGDILDLSGAYETV